MLLRGRAGQRLEHVGVVGGAVLQRPLLHRLGDRVGEGRVERLAAREGRLQLLEDVRRAGGRAARRPRRRWRRRVRSRAGSGRARRGPLRWSSTALRSRSAGEYGSSVFSPSLARARARARFDWRSLPLKSQEQPNTRALAMPLYRGYKDRRRRVVRGAVSCSSGAVGARRPSGWRRRKPWPERIVFAPAGAAAVAVVGHRGVPAQAGDDRVDVLVVGVDPHPAARPAAAPAHEAGRVERLFEQAAGVQHVADRARAVIAPRVPVAVAAAPDVGPVADVVGGVDHRLHRGRRRGRRDRPPAGQSARPAARPPGAGAGAEQSVQATAKSAMRMTRSPAHERACIGRGIARL